MTEKYQLSMCEHDTGVLGRPKADTLKRTNLSDIVYCIALSAVSVDSGSRTFIGGCKYAGGGINNITR